MLILNGQMNNKQAPILIQLESGKDYVVYSDAPYVGFGCVLVHDDKMHRWIVLLKDYDYTIKYH
ncbi:RNA-directed DNA polymerase-like protein [Gossypium australe]|uniref:RNA-directed DNA polymerase-like protein n=1 Tax=Gossypium australe TaxID=47621 RepID=A0A5B6X2E0_9ROSI|nr:RNA-directed DNA polymerase-like protein [Gossypium australe]